jgi:hypothetical protein
MIDEIKRKILSTLQEVYSVVNIGSANLAMHYGHGLLQDIVGGGGAYFQRGTTRMFP